MKFQDNWKYLRNFTTVFFGVFPSKVANVAEILDLEPDEDADSFHVFCFVFHSENPIVPDNL